MRYHYKRPAMYKQIYGSKYKCNHPVYNTCTLFKINNKGLAVMQQRYCQKTKATYLDEIDKWLVDDLYLHKNFEKFFNNRSGECANGNHKADYVGS